MAAKNFKMAAKGLKIRNIFPKSTLKFEFKVVIFTDLFYLHMFVIIYNQIWYYYTKTASKTIQNGCQKFKMAARELKIGQNSLIYILKLKFEDVVPIDSMF